MAHRESPTRAAKQRRIAHFLAQALHAAAPGQSATLTGVQKADLEARTVGRVVFPWDADYDADRQETTTLRSSITPWSSCTALAKPTCW